MPSLWRELDGEKYAGVTSMQMDVGLDTGDMLLKEEIEIGDNDTAETVHDKLSVLGAEVWSFIAGWRFRRKLRNFC